MGNIGSQVGGWPVQAADATALWDKLVGGKAQREAGAIVVYPQSTGDPNSRQVRGRRGEEAALRSEEGSAWGGPRARLRVARHGEGGPRRTLFNTQTATRLKPSHQQPPQLPPTATYKTTANKTNQFFNNGFWSCSVGVCIDKTVDDVGFLEQVVSQLPAKFGADESRVYLSGKSAGGILLHAALCRSPIIAQKARAAVDIIGSLPEPMAASCAAPNGQASLVMIHGVKDEHLPFYSGVILDYVPFKSAKDAALFWKSKFGLGGGSERSLDGGKYTCEEFSGGRRVVLCGIQDAGHTTDLPYVGAPFDLAWGVVNGRK